MSVSSSELRAQIRSQIKPFRHERLFPTGWAGELSFAEIHTDLTPNLTRLLRYYKRPEAFLPDMLQEGFLHLWWDLSQDSTLLAKANKGDALRLVLDRSRPPTFVRRSMRTRFTSMTWQRAAAIRMPSLSKVTKGAITPNIRSFRGRLTFALTSSA